MDEATESRRGETEQVIADPESDPLKPALPALQLIWAGSPSPELCRQIDLKLSSVLCLIGRPRVHSAGGASLAELPLRLTSAAGTGNASWTQGL